MAVQCRLCALFFFQLKPTIIFNRGILAKIKDLTGLWLQEEEHLPRHICPSCLNELSIFTDLRQRIQRNHNILNLRREVDSAQDLESQMSSSESEGDSSCVLTESEQSYDIQSINDLIDWKLYSLEKPESPDFDHLHKYDSNESDQESEDCDVWSNLHKLESTDPYKSVDPNFCVAEVQYQNTKSFESDEESEDYEKWQPYNCADQDTQKLSVPIGFPKNGQELSNAKGTKPLVEISSAASKNVIRKADLKDPKGEFIHIKTNLTIKKAIPALLKPEDGAVENIPKVKRRRACKALSLDCTECGKSFKTTYNLKMHMVRHTGQKDFACSFCERQFVSKHLKKLHERVRHLGEQPFKCKFCPDTFFTSTAKNRHERIRHIRDRSYKCDECNSKFNTKTCLNKHKFLHTGQKPYCCNICNINFAERQKLKSHIQTQNHQKRATAILDAKQCWDSDEVNIAVDSIFTETKKAFT
ncbi:zinc finger protein 184 [Drosophila subpulchrella]|uniref:zinc finger protein 184 n=1 Tax=Drosophila subpulchrella TaxID=1486046 RepID=UPI0018A17B23|nr:zinc finger protein 184 [Drosophila subpulchrella]XP_037724956.1 zinc finger protein 184 [Drosophila subpulchrella]